MPSIRRPVALAAALSLVALLTGCVTDLGSLPGGTGGTATDINEAGTIVGTSNLAGGDTHAFLRRRGQTMTDLGTIGAASSRAEAVNESEEVVGSLVTTDPKTAAFRWAADTGMVELPSLGGIATEAKDVNDAGFIVGWSATTEVGANGYYIVRAVVWDPTTHQPTVLPGLEQEGSAQAEGINEAGDIVGYVTVNNGNRAVMWKAGTHEIVSLAGPDVWSEAHAINESGTIVGFTASGTWDKRAVRWTAGTHEVTYMFFCKVSDADATAINDDGVIVGVDTGRAFRFTPEGHGRMEDLGTLGGLAANAQGVNNAGVIVGSAQDEAGQYRPASW